MKIIVSCRKNTKDKKESEEKYGVWDRTCDLLVMGGASQKANKMLVGYLDDFFVPVLQITHVLSFESMCTLAVHGVAFLRFIWDFFLSICCIRIGFCILLISHTRFAPLNPKYGLFCKQKTFVANLKKVGQNTFAVQGKCSTNGTVYAIVDSCVQYHWTCKAHLFVTQFTFLRLLIVRVTEWG